MIKWKDLKTDVRIFVLPKLDLFCKQGLDEISLSRHAKQVKDMPQKNLEVLAAARWFCKLFTHDG